jgi:hypothetical protein
MPTPRTVGRLPFQRMRPALPQLMFDCSALPTSPIVARQRTSTLRISPEGIRSWAYGPSLATSCTLRPAERAILAPPPGRSSIAWTTVPTGMLRSGRLLPGLMSALAPFSIGRPAQPRWGEDVALLAVLVVQQRDPRGAVGVVLDVRDLGRHAVLVVATEVDDPVGTLVTAAWWRVVTGRSCCAPGLRQAVGPATSPAQDRVTSTKSATDEPRRPGVVGLYLRIPIPVPSRQSLGAIVSTSAAVRSPQATGPPKMSIVPSLSVTTARLVSLRLPMPTRVRRFFPWRLTC